MANALEEQQHPGQRPQPARQTGVHLDTTLTIRIYFAELYKNQDQLQNHVPLWASSPQPGRALYADPTNDSWPDLCEEVSLTRKFVLEREVVGGAYCVNKAIRLARERHLPMQAALWSANHDDHHGALGDAHDDGQPFIIPRLQ